MVLLLLFFTSCNNRFVAKSKVIQPNTIFDIDNLENLIAESIQKNNNNLGLMPDIDKKLYELRKKKIKTIIKSNFNKVLHKNESKIIKKIISLSFKLYENHKTEDKQKAKPITEDTNRISEVID